MTYTPSLEGLVDNYGEPLQRLPDEIYPGTNAALFNERGEILLHRRSDNGRWGLPGGRMEIGESAEACAVREMVEETCISTKIKRLVGIYSDPANFCILKYPGGHITHYVIALYEVEYVSGEPTPTEESTEVDYFPVDALPEGTSEAAVIRIADAAAREPLPFSR